MKKSLLLIVAISGLIACKKGSTSNNPTPTGGTILLSKIIANDPNQTASGGVSYGHSFAELTYNGTQLMKATLYDDNTNFEIDQFNYDSQGVLTGTTLSYSKNGVVTSGGLGGDVSTSITFSGNNISEIKYYLPGNVLHQDIKFSYTGAYLASWTTVISGSYSYTQTTNYAYDNNGNATENGFTNTFDTQHNVFLTVPYAMYFVVGYNSYQIMPSTPGKNNVVKSTYNNGNSYFKYDYQYNTDGYPSTEIETLLNTSTPNGPTVDGMYKYEYIHVN